MTDQQHEDEAAQQDHVCVPGVCFPDFGPEIENAIDAFNRGALSFDGFIGEVVKSARASERALCDERERLLNEVYDTARAGLSTEIDRLDAEVVRLTAEREAPAVTVDPYPTCANCGHAEWHLSPAIDLGLPYSGDICRALDCQCRDFKAVTVDSDDELGKWRQELYWTL